MQDSTTRLIRFATGLSLIAVSALASAVADSQVEQPQVIGQETLTNRLSLRFRKRTGSVITSSSKLIF